MTRKTIFDVQVSIRDFDLLARIDPADVRAYLIDHDWTPASSPAPGLSSYRKPYLGVTSTVTFPDSRTGPYYPQYLKALIDKVSVVDGTGALRTLEALARDLLIRSTTP